MFAIATRSKGNQRSDYDYEHEHERDSMIPGAYGARTRSNIPLSEGKLNFVSCKLAQ